MGYLTYDRMWTQAEFRTQREGVITDEALIGELINQAYLEVTATNIPFQELDTTQSLSLVDGTAAYDLPSDWYFYLPSWGRITTTDYRGRLRPETRNEYMGKTDYDDEGTPTHYHPYGGSVILRPVPDMTLAGEIDYRKLPARLTTGGVTVIPSVWDEAIVMGVMWRIYDALQEHEKFLVARNNFIQFVRSRTPTDDLDALSTTPLRPVTEESDI